jgi:hypothetical protein
MHIVLVDWHIIVGKEDDFLAHWKSALPIGDRSRMIGEFLSQPNGDVAFPWVTWDLSVHEGVTRFVNVGLWADAEAFHDQVGRYFNPNGTMLPFEYALRRRALLEPRAWRMGHWHLPANDSGGVI